MLVSDYRVIGLICMWYKIIVRLLSNHLAIVVDSIVSLEQWASMRDRHIYDSPRMASVVVAWYKKRKRIYFC